MLNSGIVAPTVAKTTTSEITAGTNARRGSRPGGRVFWTLRSGEREQLVVIESGDRVRVLLLGVGIAECEQHHRRVARLSDLEGRVDPRRVEPLEWGGRNTQ